MKVIRILAALALLGGIGAGTARATEQEMHQKRLGKYATTDPARPRNLCVCLAPGLPNDGAVGVLVSYEELFPDLTVLVKARCEFPFFDSTGAVVFKLNCIDY